MLQRKREESSWQRVLLEVSALKLTEIESLNFLDVLGLASSIVWFKSINENESRTKHLDEEIEFNHTEILRMEKQIKEVQMKLDKVLELLSNK